MAKPSSLQATTDSQPSQWQELAQDLLDNITEGDHYRKKRHTILALADAAYMNVSQATVYRLQGCASKVAHYKWRSNDSAYEAAYQFLVGDAAAPGAARVQREQEIDEQEHLAISALAEAKNVLRMAAAQAAYTLTDALEARTSHGPKWHERISAANSILDRSDQETATKVAPAISIIDAAIMKVYADDPKDATLQAGLQANEPPPKEVSDSEIGKSKRDTPDHANDVDIMSHGPADRTSDAALLALRSYTSQNANEDEE